MKYSDGTLVHLGDRVRADYDLIGVVVASIDTGEYSEEYPENEWSYLKTGVLIDTEEAGLVHFSDPETTFERLRPRQTPSPPPSNSGGRGGRGSGER